MVYRPALRRARGADPRPGLRRGDLGLDEKDIAALAATGARFTSMTGYVERRPDRPRGRRTLLADGRRSIPVARALGSPKLNLHGTGLDGQGLPVKPVEVVTGAMWLAARARWPGSRTWARSATSCSRWRT